MTLAALISAVPGMLALAGALTALPFVALPRWRKHRMLVPVAVTAGRCGDRNVLKDHEHFSDRALVLFSRAQGVMLSPRGGVRPYSSREPPTGSRRGLGTVARFGMF